MSICGEVCRLRAANYLVAPRFTFLPANYRIYKPASFFPPAIAAKVTFAVNAGESFHRARFAIFCTLLDLLLGAIDSGFST